MPEFKNNTTSNTETSVLRQLAALRQMTLPQLREKWLDLYGTEPPAYKKQMLVRRLAYRVQELFHGGLSLDAKERLRLIAEKDPVAKVERTLSEARSTQKAIFPGTRFQRVWDGRCHEVIAREEGFEYAGQMFRSLSAVAREITGTRWNGKVFFGLKKDARSGGSKHA